ncbi:MAG: hypothetical protein ACKOAY_13475 [Haliscomenobacter sp.]
MNKLVFISTDLAQALLKGSPLTRSEHTISISRKYPIPGQWLRIVLLLFIFILPIGLIAQSKKKKAAEVSRWNYELEAAGVGMQGTYQVKVWSYTRNPNEVQVLAMKNAVHGIIFKGYVDNGRLKGQRPLAQDGNLEVEQAPFFAAFFEDDGNYRKFVGLVDNGAIAPGDRIQVGKEYKIGITVLVQVGALRKELEDAGIIKSLTSGF